MSKYFEKMKYMSEDITIEVIAAIKIGVFLAFIKTNMIKPIVVNAPSISLNVM